MIDNDEGEDIHLQKLANDPAASTDADGDDDQQNESSSGKSVQMLDIIDTHAQSVVVPLTMVYKSKCRSSP